MADRLIVGIDFGTTFSGAAEAYSGNPESPDKLNIITSWPGGNNTTHEKVPSEITYSGRPVPASTSRLSQLWGGAEESKPTPLPGKRKFDAFSGALDKSQLLKPGSNATANEMRWGYQIRLDEDRFRCLKLFLDPRQRVPDYVSLPDVRHQLMLSGKNVSTVVAEYLRALFEHVKSTLIRRYGEAFVAGTKLFVVLTVPAVWSDAAKDATMKAAKAAGMGDALAMISEPEAAAIYTLQATQPNHLRVGQNFVVIDAGGGTVDLISYSIRQLAPLRLEELAKGSGSFCGGAFLNVRFEQLVRDKLGHTAFAAIREKNSNSWPTALKHFEDDVKRNFDPDKDIDSYIEFPGVADNPKAGIEGGFLTITSKEVGDIFRPIITDIMSLVQGQITEVEDLGLDVNGLLLVGGFGQSGCLYKCLRARYGTDGGKIEVLQPKNTWTAVVRGAVLWALQDAETVLNRKAHSHYGVGCRPIFDPALHPKSCRVWDEHAECYRADNRMRWYITKGQTVSSTKPVLFPFIHDYSPREDKIKTLELIICDQNVALDELSWARGAATRVACTLVADLNTVPKTLFEKRRTSNGEAFSRLSYEVGMQIESGSLRFDIRVGGKVYGQMTATFE